MAEQPGCYHTSAPWVHQEALQAPQRGLATSVQGHFCCGTNCINLDQTAVKTTKFWERVVQEVAVRSPVCGGLFPLTHELLWANIHMVVSCRLQQWGRIFRPSCTWTPFTCFRMKLIMWDLNKVLWCTLLFLGVLFLPFKNSIHCH